LFCEVGPAGLRKQGASARRGQDAVSERSEVREGGCRDFCPRCILELHAQAVIEDQARSTIPPAQHKVAEHQLRGEG
jgi:hypothetical protein